MMLHDALRSTGRELVIEASRLSREVERALNPSFRAAELAETRNNGSRSSLDGTDAGCQFFRHTRQRPKLGLMLKCLFQAAVVTTFFWLRLQRALASNKDWCVT